MSKNDTILGIPLSKLTKSTSLPWSKYQASPIFQTYLRKNEKWKELVNGKDKLTVKEIVDSDLDFEHIETELNFPRLNTTQANVVRQKLALALIKLYHKGIKQDGGGDGEGSIRESVEFEIDEDEEMTPAPPLEDDYLSGHDNTLTPKPLATRKNPGRGASTRPDSSSKPLKFESEDHRYYSSTDLSESEYANEIARERERAEAIKTEKRQIEKKLLVDEKTHAEEMAKQLKRAKSIQEEAYLIHVKKEAIEKQKLADDRAAELENVKRDIRRKEKAVALGQKELDRMSVVPESPSRRSQSLVPYEDTESSDDEEDKDTVKDVPKSIQYRRSTKSTTSRQASVQNNDVDRADSSRRSSSRQLRSGTIENGDDFIEEDDNRQSSLSGLRSGETKTFSSTSSRRSSLKLAPLIKNDSGDDELDLEPIKTPTPISRRHRSQTLTPTPARFERPSSSASSPRGMDFSPLPIRARKALAVEQLEQVSEEIEELRELLLIKQMKSGKKDSKRGGK